MVGTEAVERGRRMLFFCKGETAKSHTVSFLSRVNFTTTCRMSTNQGQPDTAPPHTQTMQEDPDIRAGRGSPVKQAAVPSSLQAGWPGCSDRASRVGEHQVVD